MLFNFLVVSWYRPILINTPPLTAHLPKYSDISSFGWRFNWLLAVLVRQMCCSLHLSDADHNLSCLELSCNCVGLTQVVTFLSSSHSTLWRPVFTNASSCPGRFSLSLYPSLFRHLLSTVIEMIEPPIMISHSYTILSI